MASILHKNTILSGNIDFYCLVCESQLRSDDDVIAHIAKPIHKKNLDAVSYMEKFKDDYIRKIKKYYYCEFCNMLLSTSATVALHLKEPNHKVHKDGQVVKRVANAVIAFNEILIDDKAWNGLVDDTCAICNEEFDKEDLHKSEAKHILNLIQIKIFVSDKNIYRKIDNRTIHCLTCNSIVAFDSMENHFIQSDHKQLYEKCRENYDNCKHSSTDTTNENVKLIAQSMGERLVEISTDNATNKESGKTMTSGVKKTVEEASIIEKTDKKKLSGIDKTIDNKLTNGIEQAVENKLTTETKKIVKNKEQVKAIPMKEQTENPKSTSTKKPTEKTSLKNSKILDIDVDICERLGAENYILLDDHKRNWCILCDWVVDSVGIASHLRSKHHEAMLKLHKNRIEKRNSETKNIQSEELPKVVNSKENQIESTILDFISEFAKKDVDVDLERMSAYCRKCDLPLECSVEIISKHIAIHNSKLITKETPKHLPLPSSTSQECNEGENHATKLHTSPVFINKKTQEKGETETDQSPLKQDLKITDEHEKDEEKKETIVVAKKETVTETTQPKSEQSVKVKPKNVHIWADEAREFATRNNLSLDSTNNTVFCRLCKARVPPPLRSMKEHVDGATHKNNLKQNETKLETNQNQPNPKKPKKSPVLARKQSQEFITSTVLVENIWMDIIINESFVLNLYSFDMITKCNLILRCQVCEVSFTENNLDRHKEMASHKEAMLVTPVITSIPNEFVREVRAGLYHCGYCNLLSSSWDDLQNHLMCSDHREHRNAASWRLRRYMPQILQQRQMREQMNMNSLIGFLMGDY